jgi:protein O-GlcNAc transferase
MKKVSGSWVYNVREKRGPFMIQETLRSALQKHQQGDLAGASSLYLRVLQFDPNNAEALGLMSMIAKDAGDNDTAIDLASKAINLKPNRVELYINLANPLIASKRFDEAIATLEKAMKVDRRSVDVLSTLGDAYQEKKEYDKAIEFYYKGLRLDRSDPILYNNLGNALNQLGDTEEAIEMFTKALSLKPDYADAHYNLGTAYQVLEEIEKAIAAFQQALKYNPKQHQASKALGAIYTNKNNLAEAMRFYQDALLNNPNPKENFDTLVAMGELSQIQSKLDAAEDCYRVALKLKKDDPAVLQKLAFVLYSQNKTEEAHVIFDQLIAANPECLDYPLSKATCVPILYPSVEAINTTREWVEGYLQSLSSQSFSLLESTKPPFYLSYHGKNNRQLLETLNSITCQYIQPVQNCSPVFNAKPKIGFISAFLNEGHTIGKLNRGLIKNISRDLFDVVVISVGKSHIYNQSDEHPNDCFLELTDGNRNNIINTILDENFDILFYTDIGMDDMTLSLAHNRLAKVQCVTWGHPDTTGLKTIDYFISSKLIEPENAQEHYTEKLFLMNQLPTFYYRPPKMNCDTVRSVLGLSDTETFYCCPQSIYKLHPEFDPVLAEILRRDPNGRLVLLSATAEKANEDLMQRFKKAMPDVVDRILLAPRMFREDFLALLANTDVMLDPFHFGGGNTTFEALSYGTPIVTMPGEFMRGRVTHGCYQKMGYTKLVANNPEEYIQLAVRLGTDPEFRTQVKAEILAHCDVLYNDHAAVRELEQFFLNALEQAKAAAAK